MKRSLCLALVAALLLTAACSAGPAPGPAAQRGEPAFERVLDRVGDDGTIDRETALEAFSLTFGPIPGVRVPAGPSEPIPSGSGPLRWITGHLAELTPAQQQAVQAVTPRPAHTTTLAAVTPSPADAYDHVYGLIEEAFRYWSRRFPPNVLLHPTDNVGLDLTPKNEGAGLAWTHPIDAQKGTVGPVSECWFYFNPRGVAQHEPELRLTAYHEMFHCFEAMMVPGLTAYYAASGNGRGPGAWLIEGAASYGSNLALDGTTHDDDAFWRGYFHVPENPLFKRTYSAIGFFAHLADRKIPVLARVPAAMEALVSQGNVAAFNALLDGASPDDVFATWPTSLFRKNDLGGEWDTTGPNIPPDAVTPGTVVASNGSQPATGPLPAYANDDRVVNVSADVLTLDAGTYARLRATAGPFDSSSPGGVYCTMGSACTCPQGSPMAGVKFTALDRGSYYLAQTGGTADTSWTLTSFSLDQFCQRPSVDPCLYGTWQLQGNPIAFPANVEVDQVNETLTIDRSGVLTLTPDIALTVQSGGLTGTGTLKGPGTIHALAVGGTIQPQSADFSGVIVDLQVLGFDLTRPVDQFVPGIEKEVTPVAYRCTGRSLVLKGETGLVFNFAKA